MCKKNTKQNNYSNGQKKGMGNLGISGYSFWKHPAGGFNPDRTCECHLESSSSFLFSVDNQKYSKPPIRDQSEYEYGRCQNYRTEVEEYEGTVIYRTLLFHNSVFLGRYEKKRILTYSYFFSSFYNSGLFYNFVFHHFPTFASFVL